MFMFIYVPLRLTNAVWSYLLELSVVGTDQKTMNPLSQIILVVNKSAERVVSHSPFNHPWLIVFSRASFAVASTGNVDCEFTIAISVWSLYYQRRQNDATHPIPETWEAPSPLGILS